MMANQGDPLNSSKLKSMNEIESESEIGPEIIHEYKLLNKGPSRISKSELLVAWQNRIKSEKNKNKDLLYLMELPYTEGPIKCRFDRSLVNWLNLTNIEKDHLKNPQKYYLEQTLAKSKRSLPASSDEETDGSALNYLDALFKQYYTLNGFGIDSSADQMVECNSGMFKRSRANLLNNEYGYYGADDELSYDSSGIGLQRKQKSNGNHKERPTHLAMMKSNVYDYFCSSLHCDVGELNPDESALIRLRFRLWSRNLDAVSLTKKNVLLLI